VPITRFTAQDFRCLESVEFEPDPRYTLIWGANASGKTSILEALAYLGRGKSFRSSQTGHLIRHGQQEFVLYGEVGYGGRTAKLGVRNSRAGLEARVDGSSEGGVAALASMLPLQVIDPAVHHLVSGGPDERRRFLDWIVFHVEHDYLDAWRRFRRALKQRNAILKETAGRADLSAWDAEFVSVGERLDSARRRVFEESRESLVDYAEALLGTRVDFDYAPGWSEQLGLAEALAESRERDWRLGTTQVGPHRADLRLLYDERQARRLVSRGQQKLLASGMILAAADIAQRAIGRPLVLLLDDPAAELDQDALGRLMSRVDALRSQVIITSLDRSTVEFPAEPSVFHVEQGRLSKGS
jgi:DNA replication and repair protein RecF